MSASTIATLLGPSLEARGDRPALRYCEESRWQIAGARAFWRSVSELAVGLEGLGVELGGRVALVAPASPGALIAELASQAIGAAVVSIDPGVRGEPFARLLRRTEPRQIFVSDTVQLDRVLDIRPDLPSLDLVLLLTSPAGEGAAAATHVGTIIARGAERFRTEPRLFDELQRRVAPDTRACVLPTETTGERVEFAPSQGNVVSATEMLGQVLPLHEDDAVLAAVSWFRASHRALRLLCLSSGAQLVLAREEVPIEADLKEIQPTVLVAESEWVDRFALDAATAVGERGWPLRRAYEWGLDLGRGRSLADLLAEPPPPESWKLRLADAALLNSYRRKLVGGRLRRIVSLGRPASETSRGFLAALGIAVQDGEDCAAAGGILALNAAQSFRPGTLGRLLPGIEGRSDGVDLLVRGAATPPAETRGNPQKKEDTGWQPSGRRLKFDGDGWVVPAD